LAFNDQATSEEGASMKRVLPALLLIAAPVVAKEKAPPPPEPATHPSWTAVRTTAEKLIKSTLFDPESAQFHWVSGFKWGFTKPLIGARVYSWVGCLSVNAKNRMGGYVGATIMTVTVDQYSNVKTEAAATGDAFTSQCDAPNVPLQPELADAEPSAGASGTVSVADELAKLAALRDKGILSQAEFDQQKAKLLSR
jgi:hypothetical protein